jgi:hypothetical protein
VLTDSSTSLCSLESRQLPRRLPMSCSLSPGETLAIKSAKRSLSLPLSDSSPTVIVSHCLCRCVLCASQENYSPRPSRGRAQCPMYGKLLHGHGLAAHLSFKPREILWFVPPLHSPRPAPPLSSSHCPSCPDVGGIQEINRLCKRAVSRRVLAVASTILVTLIPSPEEIKVRSLFLCLSLFESRS